MENYFSINASLQPRFIHVCQMFDQLLKDKHVFFTLYFVWISDGREQKTSMNERTIWLRKSKLVSWCALKLMMLLFQNLWTVIEWTPFSLTKKIVSAEVPYCESVHSSDRLRFSIIIFFHENGVMRNVFHPSIQLTSFLCIGQQIWALLF